jgi:FkbM family methyltransferase
MTSAATLSKLDRPTPRTLLRGLREEFANWYILGPLSWAALPSRCPPRGGIAPLAGRRVTVRLRGGGRAECRLDEFFSFVEIFVLREYEVPGVSWNELRTIVDVGANVGAATLWFAGRAPQATIVAVEPAATATESLSRNVLTNHLEDRVHVVRAALGDRTGTLYLDNSRSTVFARTSAQASARSEVVPSVSLPELLDRFDLSEVDLLKLDCEGAEFDVLLSCEEDVLRRIRLMVGEYHASGREVGTLTDRLEDAGFTTRISGNGTLGLFSAVRR